MEKFIATLRLMRPANIITALSDIFAGFAIAVAATQNYLSAGLSSKVNVINLILLLIATSGLYAGGIILNDVFDSKIDEQERPERLIPRGIISVPYASLLATSLFLIAIFSAYTVSLTSGILAIAICLLCVSYNALAKHHLFLGPINMGLCRSGNLLLGMSVSSLALSLFWPLLFIPLTFVAAITLISKTEAYGGNNQLLKIALLFYVLVILELISLIFLKSFHFLNAFPFLLLFIYQTFLPLFKAIRKPDPNQVRLAVRAGVISIIILDAMLVAGFTSWGYGILLLFLLPISIRLAKIFAVT